MTMDKQNRTPIEASESVRTSLDLESIKQDIKENLQYVLGKPASMITLNDQYLAVANSVRNRMIKYWINTVENFFTSTSKAVCYFSAEFLIGPQLKRNLISLGVYDTMKRATHELDMNLDEIIEHEPEPGLGNGGLGRLAAC
ncbi:MAG: glycogen/starch/alpha-glucan phosphorylase, partial [Pseudomonadota bacterium]